MKFHPRNYGIPSLLFLSTLSVSLTLIMMFHCSKIEFIRTGFESRSVFSLQNLMGSIVEKKDSIFDMDQEDERLWEHLRNQHLTKPSNRSYNLTSKSGTYANGFSSRIFRMFNRTRKGVFVEAGAYDGEGASNSLYLEKIGWEGLLVECNPIILPKLRSKNRKAWIADVCLSLSDFPQTINFSTPVDWPASAKFGRPMNDKEMKTIGIDWMKNKTWLEYQLPSFPLYSIVRAVGDLFKEIDFLSLDVEGSEMAVLKHFPFEEITVKSILVEVFMYTEAEKLEIQKFMSTKGYQLLEIMPQDHLYTLKSLNFH